MSGMRCLPRLVVLALLLPAGSAPCQNAPAAARSERIVATVNGEAIAASEVEALAPGASGDVFDRVLRGLVVEKLIDQRVAAAKIVIPDERLATALHDRILKAGGKVGYTQFLKRIGSTPERDRLELRKQLAADRLIAESLGEVPGSPQLRPELARSIRVSDREIQECYRESKEIFQRPGSVKLMMLSAPAEKFGDAAAAHQALEELLRAPSDLGALRAALSEESRFEIVEQAMTAQSIEGLIDPLRPTAQTGAVGDRSAVADTDSGARAIVVLEREPAVDLAFEDASEVVKGYLVMRKRQAAVAKLIETFVAEATVWPTTLFATPSEPKAANESG